MLDSINIGDEITVNFDLRGREWKSPQGEIKYFNSLEAWKIESKNQNAQAANNSVPVMDNSVPSIEDMPVDAKDDLPF